MISLFEELSLSYPGSFGISSVSLKQTIIWSILLIENFQLYNFTQLVQKVLIYFIVTLSLFHI